MLDMCFRFMLISAATALLATQPLSAQVVSGAVTTTPNLTPLAGALITLLRAGKVVDRSVSDSLGSYVVRARTPGAHELLVKRIGTQPLRVQVDSLGIGEARRVDLVMSAIPVPLATVHVKEPDRCGGEAIQAESTARLLDEALSALRLTQLTGQRGVRAELRRYKRLLDPKTEVVKEESLAVLRGIYRRPFFSYSPEQMAATGFVWQGPDGAVTFMAPDAELLSSDWFVATHCFRAVSHESDSSMIGLALHASNRVTHPDLDGVLWFDRVTAELRLLEARYTHLPISVADYRIGAGVWYQRLADGKWVVSEWVIRTPVLQTTESARTQIGNINIPAHQVETIVAFQEDGGYIQLSGKDAVNRHGSILGHVFPSLNGGHRRTWIILGGTGRIAFPDSLGDYSFDDVLPGKYTLIAARESSASESGAILTRQVNLKSSTRITYDFRLPAGDAALPNACPETHSSDKSGVFLFFADTGAHRVLSSVSYEARISRVTDASMNGAKMREERMPARTSWDGASAFCGRQDAEQWLIRIGTDPVLRKLDLLRPRALEVKLLSP